MSQLLGDWQDYPANLNVETYPLKLYSVFNATFTGSQFIKPNHNTAPQNAWLIGPRDRLSWGFRLSPSAHRGGSLLIHAFYNAEGNPALSQNIWRVYRLNTQGNTAGAPQNWASGLKVHHLYVYLEIVTHEANLTVDGFVMLEAT